MDNDHQDLVQRLFVLATEILEDAHEPISRCQSKRHGTASHIAGANLLIDVAQALSGIGIAITAAARPPSPPPRHKR